MAEIQLRDIQLTYDGETLTISSLKDPDKSVELDPGTVEDLVEFVHLFAPVEEETPKESNRRESFRVPVLDESGLKLTLTVGGKQFKTRPTNISMTGVFIELPENSPVKLGIGDEVEAEMHLDKWHTKLAAIVRRQENDGFGLFFPECIREEHVEPPPLVRRIVMDLQRRWMLHLKES